MELTSPADGAALARLLRAADTSWTTALGVSREWRRQGLVTRAFLEGSGRARAAGATVATLQAVDGAQEQTAHGPDDVVETVLSLAVDRPGRRLRAELLDSHGEELRTDLLVVDGDFFWARTGSRLTTNHGNVDHEHGGGEVADLLTPGRVPELFELTVLGAGRVAGRACVRVQAVPLPGRFDFFWDLPFAMAAGGEDFRLAVDLATGVLLGVEKLVDGELAETVEWLELDLDVPLAEELFAPLS